MKCSRCEKEKGKHWENGWPNFGKIEIGFSAQMEKVIKIPYKSDLVEKMEPQKAVLKWGNEEKYNLCSNCQEELIVIIGNFFNNKKTDNI
jgi:hypothetical protein